MKRALTLLLTAAYVCVAAPAFGDESPATSAEPADSSATPAAKGDGATKAKKEKKAKATKKDADSSKKDTDSAKKDGDKKDTDSAKKDGDKKDADSAKKDGDKKDTDTAKKDADSTKKDSTSDDGKTAKTKPAAKGNIATRTASFFTGTFFGTPIAIVREIGGETKIATKDLVGETNNWFLIVPALPMGLIGGILSGTPQGLLFGVKNAFEGSLDQPFSKEAFSLDDELEE